MRMSTATSTAATPAPTPIVAASRPIPKPRRVFSSDSTRPPRAPGRWAGITQCVVNGGLSGQPKPRRPLLLSCRRRRDRSGTRAAQAGMAMDEQPLLEAIGLSPIAMVVSNPRRPDNPLELVNEAFCALTGYGEAEILGRN